MNVVQVTDSSTIDPNDLIEQLDAAYDQLDEIEVDITDEASGYVENNSGPSHLGTTEEVETTPRVSETNANDEGGSVIGGFSDILSGGREERGNVRKRRANQSGAIGTLVELQEKRIKLEEVRMEQEMDIKRMEMEQKMKIREMEVKSNERVELARIKAEFDMKERLKMFEMQMNVRQE